MYFLCLTAKTREVGPITMWFGPSAEILAVRVEDGRLFVTIQE